MSTAEIAFSLFSRPQRLPRNSAEMERLAAAQQRIVDAQGEEVVVWTWGHGPPVLLVHGWSGRGSQFEAFVGPLLAAGFSVSAIDAPAHGDARGEALSMCAFGEAVLAASRAVAPVGLICHSVGSPMSLYAFAKGLKVEASVHIAGPLSLRQGLRAFAGAMGLSDDERKRLVAMVENHMGLSLRELDEMVVGDHLRHPALLIHADDDAEVPLAASQALAAVWPTAQVKPLADAGHTRILRDPRAIAAAVEFLSNATPPPAPPHLQDFTA